MGGAMAPLIALICNLLDRLPMRQVNGGLIGFHSMVAADTSALYARWRPLRI